MKDRIRVGRGGGDWGRVERKRKNGEYKREERTGLGRRGKEKRCGER